MPVVTTDSSFYNAIIDNIAYNNKYKVELAVTPTLQNIITAYSAGSNIDGTASDGDIAADPTGVYIDDNTYLSLMCKSTVFPSKEMNLEFINSVNGRKVPLYGDITFDNKWSATFYNDREHRVRKFFLSWMEAIHNWTTGVKGSFGNELQVDGTVIQAEWLQATSNYQTSNAGYQFSGLFPTRVGDIAMDEVTPITLQEFTVDFSFFDFRIISV